MRVSLTTHGPFVALTVVGVWLRLAGLERLPLSPAEAAHAWAAWAAVTDGAPPDTAAGSPLLFGLQYGLFTAVGASDTVARLGPALAGAAAMVAPWSLRHVLGPPVAVALAALLAFDPLSIALGAHGHRRRTHRHRSLVLPWPARFRYKAGRGGPARFTRWPPSCSA
jgi:predicted membrane-bound mannosyltransferase